MRKFTSRKLLLSVAAFITAIANQEPLAAALAAVVYVIAEAFVDGKREASTIYVSKEDEAV